MSVSAKGIEIANRFFQAIDILKAQKKIKSLRSLTEKYGLNYGNFHTMKTHPETYALKAELIASLAEDFGLSTEWILLGKGRIFKARKEQPHATYMQ